MLLDTVIIQNCQPLLSRKFPCTSASSVAEELQKTKYGRLKYGNVGLNPIGACEKDLEGLAANENNLSISKPLEFTFACHDLDAESSASNDFFVMELLDSPEHQALLSYEQKVECDVTAFMFNLERELSKKLKLFETTKSNYSESFSAESDAIKFGRLDSDFWTKSLEEDRNQFTNKLLKESAAKIAAVEHCVSILNKSVSEVDDIVNDNFNVSNNQHSAFVINKSHTSLSNINEQIVFDEQHSFKKQNKQQSDVNSSQSQIIEKKKYLLSQYRNLLELKGQISQDYDSNHKFLDRIKLFEIILAKASKVINDFKLSSFETDKRILLELYREALKIVNLSHSLANLPTPSISVSKTVTPEPTLHNTDSTSSNIVAAKSFDTFDPVQLPELILFNSTDVNRSDVSKLEYENSFKYLGNVERKFLEFKQNASDLVKKLRNSLMKAVTLPINQISLEHRLNKLSALCNLLDGHSILMGDVKISTGNNPIATDYCVNLIADRLFKQASDVVPSQPDYAFSIAYVSLGLWIRYPYVGKTLVAYIYRACPWIVPLRVLDLCDSSTSTGDADRWKKLGYLLKDDGGIEKHDQYLKRMGGLIRFYIALCVSDVPVVLTGGFSEKQRFLNPLGLRTIWRLLAQLLNVPPSIDFTECAVLWTLLYEILAVAGYSLRNTYGKQFEKLIKFISVDYLRVYEDVAVKSASQASFCRLKNFLDQNKFPKCNGLYLHDSRTDVASNLWTSSSLLYK